MVVGHYERITDSGVHSADVTQNQNGSYSVKLYTKSLSDARQNRHSEWGLDANLISNSLIKNVIYYRLNLNFNDDRLTVIEGGKNPFFAPGVSYAGTYGRALVAAE